MCQTLLVRPARITSPCLTEGGDSRASRPEAEKLLRDMALVYHLTSRVKEDMLRDAGSR